MERAADAVRTVALGLAYEGTAYHGFGVQPGRLTIQEVLEGALAACMGERVRVTAAGRTDAGVHAVGQVVSVVTRGRLGADALVRALNARLPDDVQVRWATDVPDGFDARRSALRRHYRYCIWNQPLGDVWRRRWTWHLPGSLDLDTMERASDSLIGKRDFGSFASQMSREPLGRTAIRTVERANWRRDGPVVSFEITADAFLRHMVRGLVGTLVQVGRGKLDREHFEEIVAAADRRRAGPNAPSRGLTLIGIEYPEGFGLESSGREGPNDVSLDHASRDNASLDHASLDHANLGDEGPDHDDRGRERRPTHLSSDATGVPRVARGTGTPRGDGG